jgi:hypothetical protein
MLQKPPNLRIITPQHKIVPTEVVIKLAVIALILVIVLRGGKGLTA